MALRAILPGRSWETAGAGQPQSVKLRKIKDKATKQINFQSGVLEMRCPYAMGIDEAFSDGEIREILEKGL